MGGTVSVRPSKSVTSVVLIVFVTVPGVVELTQTVRVQVAPAAIPRVGWIGLVQLMLLAPVVAVSVPPWQAAFFVAGVLVPPAFLLVIVTPVGRLSVMLTLDRLVSEGAVILMVRRVFVPGRMLGVPNDLLPVTGRVEAFTVKLAVIACSYIAYLRRALVTADATGGNLVGPRCRRWAGYIESNLTVTSMRDRAVSERDCIWRIRRIVGDNTRATGCGEGGVCCVNYPRCKSGYPPCSRR